MKEIQSFEDVIHILKNECRTDEEYRKYAIAGMIQKAKDSIPEGSYYKDTVELINQLSLAKCELDTNTWHNIEVAMGTSVVLATAQFYLHENTIPPTEWPTPRDVLEKLMNKDYDQC